MKILPVPFSCFSPKLFQSWDLQVEESLAGHQLLCASMNSWNSLLPQPELVKCALEREISGSKDPKEESGERPLLVSASYCCQGSTERAGLYICKHNTDLLPHQRFKILFQDHSAICINYAYYSIASCILACIIAARHSRAFKPHPQANGKHRAEL